MSSITDYLYRIQELTNKNLKILTAIQEAFSTKKDNVTVNIGGSSYVVPSFISLENKISSLQNNFENLVDIPKTGEASLTLDGNTQRIRLAGYSVAPSKVDLENVTNFEVENNDIFKDFLTPCPYLHIGLPTVANNCKTVNVKKISFRNQELAVRIQDFIKNQSEETPIHTGQIEYKDVRAVLNGYVEDVDYIEYDTLMRLPLKTPYATGEYTINKIVDWYLDNIFEEHYTIQVNEDLTYIQNGVIERNIIPGDYLLTNDNKNKLLVEEVHDTSKELKVKVINGAYTNLTDMTSGLRDKYTLKYYQHSDLDEFKYINIPLEEDRYICVFIAPVDDELNTTAAFGLGLYFDTYTLTVDIDGTIYPFDEYYKNYVHNVGDTLFGMVSMFDAYMQNYTKDEFDTFTGYMPAIEDGNITVTQINKHLNDAAPIQHIRKLYTQKVDLKSNLTKVNNDINSLNSTLKKLSLDDSNREQYQNQLAQLANEKVSITKSLVANVSDIATSANNSEVPIENAKYHIRGYVDTQVDSLPTIIGVDIEYRYKNKNKFTGNATTINENFIFSDWNRQSSFINMKQPSTNGIIYLYQYPANNDNMNEPSFNQIDIPISQGELVDIRVRYIYDLGYPFVKTTSAWSSIYTVEFPVEYLANIEILDIIKENNDDALKYGFEGILEEHGVIKHVDDKQLEQDLTYFHKASSIASGFYTPERKIIPLFDKLSSFNDAILQLQSEVLGAKSENLIVSIADENRSIRLLPYTTGTFEVRPYASIAEDDYINIKESQSAPNTYRCGHTQLNITLYNNGKYTLKLHSIFPGINSTAITENSGALINASAYVNTQDKVFMNFTDNGIQEQNYNQTIYFRILSKYGNEHLVENSASMTSPAGAGGDWSIIGNAGVVPYVDGNTSPTSGLPDTYVATLYPYILDESALRISDGKTFYELAPGESITIPMMFYYGFVGFTNSLPEAIVKTFSFDVRTSLYQDPVNYTCKIIANYQNKTYNKIIRDVSMVTPGSVYNSSISTDSTGLSIMATNANMLATR